MAMLLPGQVEGVPRRHLFGPHGAALRGAVRQRPGRERELGQRPAAALRRGRLLSCRAREVGADLPGHRPVPVRHRKITPTVQWRGVIVLFSSGRQLGWRWARCWGRWCWSTAGPTPPMPSPPPWRRGALPLPAGGASGSGVQSDGDRSGGAVAADGDPDGGGERGPHRRCGQTALCAALAATALWAAVAWRFPAFPPARATPCWPVWRAGALALPGGGQPAPRPGGRREWDWPSRWCWARCWGGWRRTRWRAGGRGAACRRGQVAGAALMAFPSRSPGRTEISGALPAGRRWGGRSPLQPWRRRAGSPWPWGP